MWLILMMVTAIFEAASTNPPTHQTLRPPFTPMIPIFGIQLDLYFFLLRRKMASFLNDPNRDRSLPDTCPYLPPPPLLCPNATLPLLSTAPRIPSPHQHHRWWWWRCWPLPVTHCSCYLLLAAKSGGTLSASSPVVAHSSLRPVTSPSLPFPSLFLSLGDVKKEGKREKEERVREREGDCQPERGVSGSSWWRRQSVGQFHWEEREKRMVGTGEKKNKKDNFGKSLDPGAISTQNM